ncbi:hypothetical protein ACQJBY_050828 [Aegilops geniculata]
MRKFNHIFVKVHVFRCIGRCYDNLRCFYTGRWSATSQLASTTTCCTRHARFLMLKSLILPCFPFRGKCAVLGSKDLGSAASRCAASYH